MSSPRLDICIIGMGPRGLSVLERICANAREIAPHRRIAVHVVDPHPAGAGQVWRTTQSRHLLMNTVASQVTMFTDASVDLEGPLLPGPSLHEWARFLTLMGPFDGHQYPSDVLDEAAALGPDSYPTRAFYGHYLRWVFRRVVDTAPDHVRVHTHRSRAVALDDGAHPAAAPTPSRDAEHGCRRLQTVHLEDGTRLGDLHAVILAQGHLPTRATTRERALTRFAAERDLVYFPPANPADADLARVRPGERVGLLGLGLNFFDYMALFTVGRGGRFARRDDGSLRYLPSGDEPRLYAGSRRGVPFHSRGENEKGPYGRHAPLVLTPEVIDDLRARAAGGAGVDFRRDVWPLVAKEVETVYYATFLAAEQGVRAAETFRRRYLAAPWNTPAETRVLDTFGFPRDRHWDWERIARPYGDRTFTGPDDFRAWLLDHLRHDIAEARAGNVSGPLKAALDVLRDLRNEVRLVVDHRGLTGHSHHRHLDGWYTPLNAFLSIGPPVRRIEEAVALIDAGVLEVLGPDATAHADAGAGTFALRAGAVPGSEVRTSVLVDARLPDTDLRRTADPLLGRLLADGGCRAYGIPDPDGTVYQTGGLEVTERLYRLVDAAGRPHPRRFAFGVPTEAVHWVTAAGIRPGVNSVTLSDADAVARAALALVAKATATASECTKATV
ncbi:FAD/NAD(P)-binding protein [Streptomyces noursei]|uniref:FAD/NAD(P)-binding protein n=1 Tax=Streptomyces noursei TaxID=1971 RepID=UPI00167A5DC0|nr:FAD/NAD(P)-binding protein [Streptomyces noursei]MCZ1014214.1 FAD/NAD(P)-binding protein [Streptomyces noursei]